MTRARRWLLSLLVLAGVARLGLGLVPLPAHLQAGASRLLLDRQGRVLRDGWGQNVSLEQLSPWMVPATLAAEDHRFYAHWGLDAQATLGAAWSNLRAGRVVAGGSTLTQQVLANLSGRPRGFSDKALQSLQALRLEREMSKKRILELYLNLVPYGNNTRGIESAARFYFDRPAASLSLAQCAFLAGLPRGPDLYNPLIHRERAQQRQRWVLDRLLSLHQIDASAWQAAVEEPLLVAAHPGHFLAPHFCELVLQRLPSSATRVQTTLDGDLQRELEGIVRVQVESLRDRGVNGAAVVVLDNISGQLLALVGSPNFFDVEADGQVDLANSLRQPGSTLKPFTYGLALENGLTPASLLMDLPVHYPTSRGDFAPTNYDGNFHGPVRLRTALASSYNVPAVRLAHQVGVPQLLERLHQAGFASLDQAAEHYGLALTLGSGEVTLLELTRAYMALACGGNWKEERLWSGLQNESGQQLEVPQAASRRIFSPQVAFLLSDILSDPAARAPGFGHDSVLSLPFPCAVKTGTSRAYRDNWTIGYSTRYTVGVWAGHTRGGSMQQVSGVAGAGPIFREVMLRLHRGQPPEAFPLPRGLRRGTVCTTSGQRPGPHCQGTAPEWMGKSEPELCSLHQPSGVVYPREYTPWAQQQGLAVETSLHITFPGDGDVFVIDPRLDRRYQTVQLTASGQGVHWSVDGRPAPQGEWALQPGRHRIRAQTSQGASEEVSITVRR